MRRAMEGFRSGVLALLALAAAACGRPPAPAFPEWSVRQLPPPPESSSSNAFDHYALAALDVEAKDTKYIDRVFFTPGQKLAALERMARGLAQVEAGTRLRCAFRFVPTPPLTAPPYQRGWRLLGRGLVWRIEAAIAAGDLPKAVTNTVVATRFGFDLCGGGATDASLGLVIVDEARQALTRGYGQLQNADYARLAQGLQNALHAKPPFAAAVQNEERNMMAGVQFVQDAYRTERYADIEANFGPDIRDAVDFLKKLRRDDTTARPAYFTGFAGDAEQEVKWLMAQAAVCAAERPPPPPATNRPWRRFAKHFFTTMRPLIAMNDATVARTRLLIIRATIRRIVRLGHNAPSSLGDFPTFVSTDPYSGKTFIYRTDGPDFDVYGVGANVRDDGGEGDDLRVEGDVD